VKRCGIRFSRFREIRATSSSFELGSQYQFTELS
jgi:hypothetical protein